MAEMVEARGLAHTFTTKRGPVEAVRPMDLAVSTGEIVGLLGPNGAGKTTTLRMLATLLRPTAGTAVVAGHDLLREPQAVRGSIGYVAQVGGMPGPGTLLGEELIVQARLHGMSRHDARASLLGITQRLELAELRERPLTELSGGQRRRFDVAVGLMHSPRLLFLDEPTTGLDPQSRANLWGHIREVRDDHEVTVLLTTHYLDEADALCDRIMVMDNGRIIADDKPDKLKSRVAGDVITIGVSEPDVAARAEEIVRTELQVRQFSCTGTALIVTVDDGPTALPQLLRLLGTAGVRPTSIAINRPTLDDVFLALTGRSLREGEN